MLAWQKKRQANGTLLKISKPVERLFAYLEEHPFIHINQFCRLAHIHYYTAKNIISDLLAIDALQYVVVEKRILYRRSSL